MTDTRPRSRYLSTGTELHQLIADHHHRAILRWFFTHPGGAQVECANALKLSAQTVNRHMRVIKAEWRKRDQLTRANKKAQVEEKKAIRDIKKKLKIGRGLPVAQTQTQRKKEK